MSPLFNLLVVGILLSLSLCHASPARKTRDVTAVSAVSSADETVILNEHNTLRKGVFPEAMNMRKMHWNSDLANVAQQWTDQCTEGHDDNYQRRKDVDIGVPVGQNYASDGDYQNVNWSKMVKLWHSENQYFVFASGSNTTGEDIGHYTQVVWGNSALVGCGQKLCGQKMTYACNYAFGNQNINYPYEKGTSCASCAGKCVEDNLCECPNGMICKNGGIIDLTTCTCTCQFGWTGASCETCPGFDSPSYCGKYSFSVENCGVYTNLPEECPVLCSFCPDKCNGLKVDSCLNGGTLVNDASGCRCNCTADYGGDKCQTRTNCDDEDDCQQYGVSKCTGQYEDFIKNRCPTMCGVCSI